MATYAELREKYVNGQGKEQQTKKREAPDNAKIVEAVRQYTAQHQAENAGKWAAWQEVATARDNASAAARAAEEAQKKYDEYLLTDEAQSYMRQNQAAKGAQMMQGTGISTPYAAGMQQQYKIEEDELEKQLRAKRDYYQQQAQQAETQRIMKEDLAEFEKWPEEDRLKLQISIENGAGSINSLLGAATGQATAQAFVAQNELEEKYGAEIVDRMMRSVSRSKNEKIAGEVAALGKQTGDDHAVLGSVATVPMKLIGAISAPLGYLSEAVRGGKGQYPTLDPNNLGNLPNAYSVAVRGQVAKNISGDEYDEQGNQIKEGGALRQGGAYLYQGVMSLADSIARAAAGGGGLGTLALAATGSFSQTVSEASKQGATPQQAIILGIGNAALEAATEKVPLDNMLKAAKGGIKGAKAIAKEALRQAAIEATEEEISLFGSLLLEAAVLQEKSAYQQSIAEGIANGMSYEEAKEQADKAVWAEALNTAMVSAVAGGLSGGGSAIAGNVFNGSADAAQKPVEAATQQKETQTREQPDVAQAVVQGLTQAQETEAQANAAQMPKERQAAQDVADMLMGKEKPAQPAQATDNSTGSKSIKLYRGYNQSDDPTRKNLTSKQSVYNILGREDPNEITNLLPLAYYTENEEDARSYADMDVRTMDEYRKNGIYEYRDRVMRGKDVEGLSEKEYADRAAKRSFLMLHGREPNAGGRVERYDYTPGKVLDLTELGETTSVDAAYKVLADKFGIEPSELDDILTLGNNFKDDFPVFALLRNTPRDNLGTKIVDLAKKGGHDSIRYSEDGNIHYAIVTDRQGWDKKLTKDMDASNIQQQSTEDVQGIKGTGAAEANFSGKAQYQDLLYEGNVQPDREGDVRPMEVPKTDSYGRNVSEFVGNAYGAEVTPDKMANVIEELVQEGALGFDRRSNQDALNDAAKVIENSTPSAITKRITGNIANGKIKDGDIEEAMLLYSHYANKNGERAQAQAAELMVDLTTMAHMTGRNLQLFKLLRKLTPEGQVMTIKRTVEQNVENMVRSGKAKDGSCPQINDQLLEDYKKAAAENARAVSAEQKAESEAKMQEIQQAIMVDAASQIQTTFKAKWDAWRYMAMLGNGKTQIRNFAGNVFFMPYKAAKDTIGAAFELAVPKDKRTKALGMDKQLLNWAKQDSKTTAVHDALKYTGKLGDDATTAKFADNVKVFDTKALEAVRKFIGDLPAKADLVFKNQYYASSLAGFLKARGYTMQDVKGGKVSEAVMAEARGYAINEAMKATFNDCNAFSDAISSIGRKETDNAWSKAINYAAESVLPFRRTPANVVVRFAEYSPAGMAKGVWDMATKVSSGKISASAAVDQIASGLTGTSVMMLGYLMAKGIAGVKLTGGGTDEDEKRQGHQDYALEFSMNGQEYSYKIDWAAPANLPLFVGAALYESMEGNGEDTNISTFSKILQVGKNAVEPMLQLSCMSSLNDLVEGIRYAPEGEALYSIAADIATGYFTQGIPALLRQAGQAIPKDKQTTFANNPDPNVRELQKLGAQIPIVVAPKFQTEKRNAWGETETTESALMRAFNSFINPGSIKKIDNSELEKEITRLGKAQEQNVTPPDIPKKVSYTSQSGEKLNDYQLTQEQYQKLAQTQGQTAKKILDQMVTSSDYKKLTDYQKAYAIKAAYEYAQEQGKKAALPDYHSKAAEWISETKESDIQTFVTRGATQALNSAISSAVSNLGYGLPVTEATKADMEETYKAFANMSAKTKEQILDEASAATVKYLTARQAGISAGTYLETEKQLLNIKPEEGRTSPRSVQKAETIANSGRLTEAQKIAMIKAESSDSQDENLEQIIAMGYTAADYAKLYRDHEDYTSGTGKKKRTVEKWMNDYGISNAAAEELYKVFS